MSVKVESVAMDAGTLDVDSRRVLQPACNRVPTQVHQNNNLKKKSTTKPPTSPKPPQSPSSPTSTLSPLSKYPTPPRPQHKRSPSLESTPISPTSKPSNHDQKEEHHPQLFVPKASFGLAVGRKKLRNLGDIAEVPGSIAAARREEAKQIKAQRKQKIAHYGRAKKAGVASPAVVAEAVAVQEQRRCSFITANSDPVYVVYHDEEWGVPVHDDRMLFELLVLSGAQVGLDWTTMLKKRETFRATFCAFEAEAVSQLSERQMASISAQCGLDLTKVRGAVDNAKVILQIKREFGSLEQYIWGFVSKKPIITEYKSARKIPVKTSKSESVSKDMVKRGFRSVGPTVIHSFMQAAGLTNDHLLSCPRHPHHNTPSSSS
ncbi:hypothetical protein AMTRI_Chr02g256160 [Amborella trichopoda]